MLGARTISRSATCARVTRTLCAVASVPSMAWSPSRFTEQDVSLRWSYVHLIEEYARHNGHADLLQERIDGTVGF